MMPADFLEVRQFAVKEPRNAVVDGMPVPEDRVTVDALDALKLEGELVVIGPPKALDPFSNLVCARFLAVAVKWRADEVFRWAEPGRRLTRIKALAVRRAIEVDNIAGGVGKEERRA